MYKKGMYNSVMKVAISKRKEIAEILNKFRTIPLSEDWYPIDVVCDKCGKIATTKILNYDEKTSNVEYVCNPDMILLHRKNPVQGCGHTGKKSILNGGAKLTWRVEWAARWTFLKATCEPFGKEHSAAGGSWDTAKEIVKIFDRNPPYPVEYEHFLVNGEKMSKSKGNVISLLDMLQYMKPEHLRYWMYQGRLTIAKDINLKNMIPRLFDEFNKSEKIFFGKYSTENKRKDNNYKRAYQLSNYIIPKRPSFYIEFEKMLELVKILPEKDQLDFVILKLKEWDSSIKVSPFDKDDLSKELGFVKKYYSKFMRSEITGMKLNENERYVIKDLIKSIQQSKNVEELQESIFEIPGEHNMSMGEFFKVIYEILLNSNRGPKLGPYIFQVGKEEIIKKLESVL
jgi:lysyl-tRNA synthetase class 1